MIRLTGPADAQARFGILGEWFGAPAVCSVPTGVLIDGKIRSQFFDGYPCVMVETPRETVRVLCAVGEYERAATYVPANITPGMVSAWAGIPRDWVPLMQLRPKVCRSSAQSIDRIEVVRRVRKLLEVADAGETITATDLRWALGRFALHCRGRNT